MDITRVVGENIRRYREKFNITQEKLAELTGLHATFIGKVERGQTNATLRSIQKIADGLNITVSTLLIMDEDEATAYEFCKIAKELTTKERQALVELIVAVKEFRNAEKYI